MGRNLRLSSIGLGPKRLDDRGSRSLQHSQDISYSSLDNGAGIEWEIGTIDKRILASMYRCDY